MKNEVIDFKEALINATVANGLFKRVPSRSNQYRSKYCPFCGDTNWHMYIMINVTDDSPVLYHCFKCNNSGLMNKEFLDYFNIGDLRIPKTTYRKRLEVSGVSTSVNLNSLSCNENDDLSIVKAYINKRVGHIPTLSDLRKFQYMGKPFEYVKEYINTNAKYSKYFKENCWFRLTNGNIIGRSYDKEKDGWMKYNSNNVIGKGLYTMKQSIDTFEHINIVIAEGIFDVIGLYYNFPINNAFYIATLGRNYHDGISHILNMGIFGDSVTIKIFKDSDVDTSMIHFKKNEIRLFKKIEIYQNIIGKDYGVTEDNLDINKIITFNAF